MTKVTRDIFLDLVFQLRKVEEEIKKVRSEADDQRDALANEVSCFMETFP